MTIALCLALITAGCDSPGSTCERAQHRLAECNEEARAEYAYLSVDGYVELPITLQSCESISNQCLASCVVDSPCSVINFDIFGKGDQTDPNKVRPVGAGQFSLCVDYCYALSHPNR